MNETVKKLHPTLKKCKCGFIGQRTQLYKHLELRFDDMMHAEPDQPWTVVKPKFYKLHGEVPLNEDEGEKFYQLPSEFEVNQGKLDRGGPH